MKSIDTRSPDGFQPNKETVKETGPPPTKNTGGLGYVGTGTSSCTMGSILQPRGKWRSKHRLDPEKAQDNDDDDDGDNDVDGDGDNDGDDGDGGEEATSGLWM